LMINKNSNELSPESISHLKSLLQDPGSYIELDHPDNDLPLQDTRFTDFFDLLNKDL